MRISQLSFSVRAVRLSVVLAAMFWAALTVGAPSADAAPTVLVKVDSPAEARSVAKRHGLRIARHFHRIGWVELTPSSRQGGDAVTSVRERLAISGLREDPVVEEVDFLVPGEAPSFHFVPNDRIFAYTFGNGTAGAWHLITTNFPSAWDITTGSPSVRVAVIDSEFDTENPDLRDELVGRYNAASGKLGYRTEDIKRKPGDLAHGSHVAGLVGASTDNGKGVAGACFDCALMGIKIGSEAAGTFVTASLLGDILEGIGYAIGNGASVINMSLGFTRPHAPLQDAINNAVAANVVVVASAGNSQQTDPSVTNYPAAYPNVIGVGATQPPNNEIAPFSTQGPYVDLTAPGSTILSTTTDPGDATRFNLPGESSPKVAVATKSGTSMAAPIVSGLAALMRSVRGDLTPDEVEGLMKQTATDVGLPGPDPVYGAGVIDAYKAVSAAVNYVRPEPPAPPPPPPPSVRRVKAKLGLSVRRKAKRRFGGRLTTGKRCRARRTVRLRKRGSKKVISRTRTKANGRFTFPRRARVKGKVFAVVPKVQRGNRICKGARTKAVRG